MSYISEINALYNLMLTQPLSTGQIVLWHALMTINNKCAWTEWFQAPNSTVELFTGLSRKGIYNARNALKQNGLIDFKTNGTKATWYKLNTLQDITQECTQGTTQECTQGCTQDTTQKGATLNRHRQDKERGGSRARFTPPTVEEVREYCSERKNNVDPETFVDFYASKGWKVGKEGMKDWKAAVRTWEKRDGNKPPPEPSRRSLRPL